MKNSTAQKLAYGLGGVAFALYIGWGTREREHVRMAQVETRACIADIFSSDLNNHYDHAQSLNDCMTHQRETSYLFGKSRELSAAAVIVCVTAGQSARSLTRAQLHDGLQRCHIGLSSSQLSAFSAQR